MDRDKDILGRKGYQKSIMDDWGGAITVWDEGIKKFPKERRFYNNRAYCYFMLKDYKSALQDCKYMIDNFPNYSRGYFRQGEILAACGKYREALMCFKQVIRLEPSCGEALNELLEVQILFLMSKGYSRYQAVNALGMAKDFEEAEQLLREGAFPDDDGELYYSEGETSAPINHHIPGHYDPLEDPENPKKCCSIWVGNMKEKISDEELKKLFSRYGKVKSIKADFSKFFVFVNYHEPEGASKAMRQLQGQDFAGNKGIRIRYPDRAMSGK